MHIINQHGYCCLQHRAKEGFAVIPFFTHVKELPGILIKLPQKVDEEERGHAGLQAALVEVQSIPQPQDPMQVVALVAKEHLKQADVASENSCEAMQRLWRVKLGPCSKLF